MPLAQDFKSWVTAPVTTPSPPGRHHDPMIILLPNRPALRSGLIKPSILSILEPDLGACGTMELATPFLARPLFITTQLHTASPHYYITPQLHPLSQRYKSTNIPPPSGNCEEKND